MFTDLSDFSEPKSMVLGFRLRCVDALYAAFYERRILKIRYCKELPREMNI